MAKIVMADEAWAKFESYVELIDKEIAAFGYITENQEAGHLRVDDIFLVPQTVSGTSVDFTSEGLIYAIERAQKDDRVNDLRFCIHSHVNMGVGFSADDEEMIELMAKTGTPWFVSVIFNKRKETRARLDMFQLPIAGLDHLHLDKVELIREQSDEELDARISEIEDLVTIEKPKPVTKGGKGAYTKTETYDDFKNKSSKNIPYGSSWFESERALHEDAAKAGWSAVLNGNTAYYWDDLTGEFKGEAMLLADEEEELIDRLDRMEKNEKAGV